MSNELLLEIFDQVDLIISHHIEPKFDDKNEIIYNRKLFDCRTCSDKQLLHEQDKPQFEFNQCETFGFIKCIVYHDQSKYQIDLRGSGGLFAFDLVSAFHHVKPKNKKWSENKISIKNDTLFIECLFH